jgi:hypothetical protein
MLVGAEMDRCRSVEAHSVGGSGRGFTCAHTVNRLAKAFDFARRCREAAGVAVHAQVNHVVRADAAISRDEEAARLHRTVRYASR